MRKKTRKIRKKIAWIINLLNIGVLAFLVAENYSPLYGAISCIIAVSTTFIATIPEAVKGELTITDTVL
jgi:uncharacterized membrane protein YkgB